MLDFLAGLWDSWIFWILSCFLAGIAVGVIVIAIVGPGTRFRPVPPAVRAGGYCLRQAGQVTAAGPFTSRKLNHEYSGARIVRMEPCKGRQQ